MGDLEQILIQEVEKYAAGGTGVGILLFPLLDEKRRVYGVNAVDYPIRDEIEGVAGVVVLARMIGDMIVIEEDATDKPLVDALMQRGVPREKIVLAYAGEPRPETEGDT